MNKVVYVLLDGLNSEVACQRMGYLSHLVENMQAASYLVKGELPSMSRPMYETIFTGVPVFKHGIVNNAIQDMSTTTSIFDILQAAKKKSLAACYYWISELYVKTPFVADKDMFVCNSEAKIQNGFFYYEDCFPDSHLYNIANSMMANEDHDFVFIHPMNIDDAGHHHGCESKQYHVAAMKNDIILSNNISKWVEQGYQVVIGSDHGMDEMTMHGGVSSRQQDTMLYIISDKVQMGKHSKELNTLQIAPLLCKLLDIAPSKEMVELEIQLSEEK